MGKITIDVRSFEYSKNAEYILIDVAVSIAHISQLTSIIQPYTRFLLQLEHCNVNAPCATIFFPFSTKRIYVHLMGKHHPVHLLKVSVEALLHS
jgi:hypothetical protein